MATLACLGSAHGEIPQLCSLSLSSVAFCARMGRAYELNACMARVSVSLSASLSVFASSFHLSVLPLTCLSRHVLFLSPVYLSYQRAWSNQQHYLQTDEHFAAKAEAEQRMEPCIACIALRNKLNLPLACARSTCPSASMPSNPIWGLPLRSNAHSPGTFTCRQGESSISITLASTADGMLR